ncbi:cobalt/nickel transport system permease protein [Paenibacillus sp. 1_12]|uniref:cobalt ECF transporter T component CbiQ n=1 Tax=Paenibacillus sp. 1_12 TaxID=1566278 RepID=UPI0008EDF209|nr:cobalt ECF transporter T component CbiQ [Paenibacillus sp. 1_12]SFK96908.1 cobalt/nickel transport system permease protein [Paenibacillus sp. 1_12]
MIKLIDTLSYKNRLRSVSPMWKCGFAAVLFIGSYLSQPVVQLCLAGWMLVWTVLYARIPLQSYILLIGIPGLFYVTSLPAIMVEISMQSRDSIAVISTNHVLFTILNWTLYISEAGLHQAGYLFARVFACISCLTFVMLTTPMSELFQVMKKLRMPALVLEIMLIMYRFLFVLTETAQHMYTAQKARGGQSGFRGRLNDTAILIVRLFGKTMQRYKALSHGLIARGFTDEIRMAPYTAHPVASRYQWESRIGVVLLLGLELWIRWR